MTPMPRRRDALAAACALAASTLSRPAAADGPSRTVGTPAAPAAAPRPIFVLNSLDANVSVIDPATWTERERIPTGKEPHHLYLTPDERSVIVANATSNSLTFIDPVTAQVQRTLGDIVDPYHLRFSPDMRWLVTVANRLDHIDLYRWEPRDAAAPLRLARRLAAPKTPSHIAIDTRSTTAYVSLQDSDQLVAIDLATQATRWTVAVGRMPADVYLRPDDRLLFVGLTGDRFVEVYDVAASPARLVQRIETGQGAHAFRSRGDGRHVFVSNRVANSVGLVDTQRLALVATMPGPSGPDCMELMSDGRTLLLSSRWVGRMSVIDIERRALVRQVAVGRSPHGIWTLDHAPRA